MEITLTDKKFEIFENVPDLYLILDPDLLILNASNAYLKATMTERKEIVGRHLFEVFPDNPELANANGVSNLRYSLEQVLKEKKPHQMEVQRYDVRKPAHQGGAFERKYWSPLNTPVLDTNNEVEFIIHKVIDVTKEIESEKNLKTLTIRTGQLIDEVIAGRRQIEIERKKLSDLFMQAPAMIAILKGPEFIFELTNPLYLKYLNKTESIIGTPLLKVLPELKDQSIHKIMNEVYRTGKSFLGQEIQVKLNVNNEQKDSYFNLVYEPFRNSENEVEGILVHAVDVTELVHNREIIAAQNKELISINKDLDNFVYTASHDLKAPINNIDALFDSLSEEFERICGNQPEVKEILNLIDQSVIKFRETIEDLATTGRIKMEGNNFDTSVNVKEVLEEVKLLLHEDIESSQVKFTGDFSRAPVIKLSKKNVKSILHNLISNSIKYRSPDRKPEIRISTEKQEHYILLTVSDNGLGIKEEFIEKVFSMYERLHDHVEGTGVGMGIVKRIVDNAEGIIEIESEVNKGTTFKIYFKN